MSIEGQRFYPGETATPQQILLLANEYRRAADILLQSGRRGEPLSRAPYRLVAIHAIELYLNALLLHRGHKPAEVRSFHHNLAARADLAMQCGLRLRTRTKSHLHEMAESREYLITPYGPEMTSRSQLNRLTATLEEIAKKVVALLSESGEP